MKPNICIGPHDTLRTAAENMNRNVRGIVVVVDEDGHLLDTITDGDIRRAVLDGMTLDVTARELSARRMNSPYAEPVRAQAGTSPVELLSLMKQHNVRQLPIEDADGRVVDLITLDDLVQEPLKPLQAIVMAGGMGTRLRPLTDNVPKSMLPVGDRPLLEHIISRLRNTGITSVSVALHHQPHAIREHFGDGTGFGVDLSYVLEDQPLGTAGALGLLHEPDGPLLVINGDILTDVDFRALHVFHRTHGAELTVAVREFSVEVPYGVTIQDGARVREIREKPEFKFFVNAGIYLLEPSVLRSISPQQRLDMPDLIHQLVAEGRVVVSFPIIEYWLDIGRHADYERAHADMSHGRGIA